MKRRYEPLHKHPWQFDAKMILQEKSKIVQLFRERRLMGAPFGTFAIGCFAN
jgi:hypothetical protein